MIKALNCLTVVMVMLTGVDVFAASYTSKEQCTAQIQADETKVCRDDRDLKLKSATSEAERTSIYRAYDDCRSDIQSKIANTCGDLDSKADLTTECKSLYQAYRTQEKETGAQCSKYGQGTIQQCTSTAQMCNQYMDIGGNDPDQVVNAMMGLTSSIGAMMVGGGAGSGCMIEDDSSLQSKRDQYDREIERLKEQNADAVTQKTDLDEKLEQKKDEVTQKIQDLDDEVNKKKIERQSKLQEQANQIQKDELKSQTKKFENLAKINKLNTEIANLQFAQQQVAIEFADSRITEGCTTKVEKMKGQLTGELPPEGAPSGAKPVPKKFSVGEMSKLKKKLQDELDTCMKSETLKRSAQLKGIIDKRMDLQAQIDTYNRAIEDEDKAVNLAKQQLEQLRAQMTTEEQNDLDSKLKKQNSLAQSVAAYGENVAKKKIALDQKVAARLEQIKKIEAKKNNLKEKYANVNSTLMARRSAQNDYITKCCGRSATKKDIYCDQVSSDYGDSDPVGEPGTSGARK